MSIGTVTLEDGTVVEIEVAGTSMVQNIQGAMECHVSLRPILPRGPRGPDGGEPLPVPRAA